MRVKWRCPRTDLPDVPKLVADEPVRPATASNRNALPSALLPRDVASIRVIRAMHLLERIALRFEEVGVPVMVLKGAALHLTVHERPEERPMSDLDLLVHAKDVDRVDELLEEMDLHRGPSEFREDFFPRFHHETQYVAGALSPVAVDLHVRPLRLVRWSRIMPDDALWRRAEPKRVGAATVLCRRRRRC
jgi:hypothetical protein